MMDVAEAWDSINLVDNGVGYWEAGRVPLSVVNKVVVLWWRIGGGKYFSGLLLAG